MKIACSQNTVSDFNFAVIRMYSFQYNLIFSWVTNFMTQVYK